MVILSMRVGYGMDMKDKWSGRKMILNFITLTALLLFLGMWMITTLGYEPYQILSGSMEPTLKIGEIVLIDTNDTTVEDGDVIAFYMGEQVVIHRVQETISNGVYITKGDGNPNVDFSPVSQEEMIGTLWIHLGWASLFWNIVTSKMKLVFVFVLAGLNVAAEVCGNKKEDVVYE